MLKARYRGERERGRQTHRERETERGAGNCAKEKESVGTWL